MPVSKSNIRKINRLGSQCNRFDSFDSFDSIQSMDSFKRFDSFDSIQSMESLKHVESLKERSSISKENKPNASQDSQHKQGRASPFSVFADLSKDGIPKPENQIQTQKNTSQSRKQRKLEIVHNSSNAIKDGVKFVQNKGNQYVQLYDGNVIPNGETSSLKEIKMMAKNHKFPVLVFDKSGQLEAHIDQSGEVIDVSKKLRNVIELNPFAENSPKSGSKQSGQITKRTQPRKNPFTRKNNKSKQYGNEEQTKLSKQSSSKTIKKPILPKI